MKIESIIFTGALLAILASCSGVMQLRKMRNGNMQASAVAYNEDIARSPAIIDSSNKSEVMNALIDEKGNIQPTDIIETAYIFSRHRQVSERLGKVRLEFDVIVPKEICNTSWQVRIIPVLTSLGHSRRLDSVLVTGSRYRSGQEKGYERYERYIKSLLPLDDDELYLYRRDLEIFLERYAANPFGVSEEEAVIHYTKRWLKSLNIIRHSRMKAKYDRYIKSPYILGGVRIDTIINNPDSSIIYRYIQEISTTPKMKHVDLSLTTSVNLDGETIYSKHTKDTVRFYISSLSSLADKRTRFVRQILKRDTAIIHEANIRFALGRHEFDYGLHENRIEAERIRSIISELTDDGRVRIDSITIYGAASPEGNMELNRRLSEARARAMVKETRNIINEIRDSRKHIFFTSIGDNSSIDTTNIKSSPVPAVPVDYDSIIENIRYCGKGEDWKSLESLLLKSRAFNGNEKEMILVAMSDNDPEKREESLKQLSFYGRISDSLFNLIRNVRYTFHLHRKDAVDDTVFTARIDTVYMKGIQHLDERDYSKALDCLYGYKDYNTGLAFLLMGYNYSAIATLESIGKTAARDYLLAVAYSRTGEREKAEHYLKEAIRQDDSYRYRSRLDPECSVLTT